MSLGRGSLVGENLHLERELGQGTYGTVWLAEHAKLGTAMAVKVLHRAGDERARVRFENEARAVAGLHSPHIVKIFDYGVTDDDEPYIVMEYLRGVDLRERLQRTPQLELADAVVIMSQAARGLGSAHARGIVHRDVKPANLFLSETDDGDVFVKLLDFGVARYASLEGFDLTATGALVGTPFYMSPEQITAPRTTGAPSDLWSLAVVAYACLTGSRPFFGETLGALVAGIQSGRFTPVREHRPDAPPAFDAFFARAFRIEPAERFPDAKAFARALQLASGLDRSDELWGVSSQSLGVAAVVGSAQSRGAQPAPAVAGSSQSLEVAAVVGSAQSRGAQPAPAVADATQVMDPEPAPLDAVAAVSSVEHSATEAAAAPAVPAPDPSQTSASPGVRGWTEEAAPGAHARTVRTEDAVAARSRRSPVLLAVVVGAAVIGGVALGASLRGGGAAPSPSSAAEHAARPPAAEVSVVVPEPGPPASALETSPGTPDAPLLASASASVSAAATASSAATASGSAPVAPRSSGAPVAVVRPPASVAPGASVAPSAGATDLPLGERCSGKSQCASGFCVDGVCCNTACSGLCQACTNAKMAGGKGGWGAGKAGRCGYIYGGEDPDNECPGKQVCSGAARACIEWQGVLAPEPWPQ